MSLITRDYKFSDIFEEVEYNTWKIDKYEKPPSHLFKPFNDIETNEIGYIEINSDDYVFIFYHTVKNKFGCFESLHSKRLFDLIDEYKPESLYKLTVTEKGEYEIYQFNQSICSIVKIFKVKSKYLTKLSFKSESDFQNLIERFDEDNDGDYKFIEPCCDNITSITNRFESYYEPTYNLSITKSKRNLGRIYDEFYSYISSEHIFEHFEEDDDYDETIILNLFKEFNIKFKLCQYSFNINDSKELFIHLLNHDIDIRFVLFDDYIKCHIYSLKLKNKSFILHSCN